jgi:GT2 family glycosyltransferase
VKTPDVEVIVVNWNSREQTLECVRAIEAQLGEVKDALLTVVDNGSHDGSASAIATHHPAVKLFALKENRGFTGGLAAALAGSSARHVVFLNNDALPQPGWLASLNAAMLAAPPDVVSVGGKILDIDGLLIDFIGGMMTFDGHAFQEGFRYPIGARNEPADGSELLFACGGNMISRRDALTRLGGFDDDYFAYLEDVDFGWRSWLAGHRVTFAANAVVRHESSSTSNRLGNFERGVLFERNALQTVIKNYGEDSWREAAGAVFYSYLHRLHNYVSERNPRAGELRRAPFAGRAEDTSNGSRSLLSRVRSRLNGTPPLAAIDDPLTAMQFRALDWMFANEQRLAEKRERVQAMRKRTDEEIFERFPLAFVPTYPGDERLFSSQLFASLRPRLPSTTRKLGDIMRT